MPVVHVLVVVQVITPLNQVVNLQIELLLVHVLVLFIVEGVLVQIFELLLEYSGLERSRVDILALLLDYLCIFASL